MSVFCCFCLRIFVWFALDFGALRHRKVSWGNDTLSWPIDRESQKTSVKIRIYLPTMASPFEHLCGKPVKFLQLPFITQFACLIRLGTLKEQNNESTLTCLGVFARNVFETFLGVTWITWNRFHKEWKTNDFLNRQRLTIADGFLWLWWRQVFADKATILFYKWKVDASATSTGYGGQYATKYMTME